MPTLYVYCQHTCLKNLYIVGILTQILEQEMKVGPSPYNRNIFLWKYEFWIFYQYIYYIYLRFEYGSFTHRSGYSFSIYIYIYLRFDSGSFTHRSGYSQRVHLSTESIYNIKALFLTPLHSYLLKKIYVTKVSLMLPTQWHIDPTIKTNIYHTDI